MPRMEAACGTLRTSGSDGETRSPRRLTRRRSGSSKSPEGCDWSSPCRFASPRLVVLMSLVPILLDRHRRSRAVGRRKGAAPRSRVRKAMTRDLAPLEGMPPSSSSPVPVAVGAQRTSGHHRSGDLREIDAGSPSYVRRPLAGTHGLLDGDGLTPPPRCPRSARPPRESRACCRPGTTGRGYPCRQR